MLLSSDYVTAIEIGRLPELHQVAVGWSIIFFAAQRCPVAQLAISRHRPLTRSVPRFRSVLADLSLFQL